MTPADGDPNPEHKSKAEAPDPAAEPPTRLREAAAGMAEAQAWKGQQIAIGWRSWTRYADRGLHHSDP
jgi:hypothetical protein